MPKLIGVLIVGILLSGCSLASQEGQLHQAAVTSHVGQVDSGFRKTRLEKVNLIKGELQYSQQRETNLQLIQILRNQEKMMSFMGREASVAFKDSQG